MFSVKPHLIWCYDSLSILDLSEVNVYILRLRLQRTKPLCQLCSVQLSCVAIPVIYLHAVLFGVCSTYAKIDNYLAIVKSPT